MGRATVDKQKSKGGKQKAKADRPKSKNVFLLFDGDVSAETIVNAVRKHISPTKK